MTETRPISGTNCDKDQHPISKHQGLAVRYALLRRDTHAFVYWAFKRSSRLQRVSVERGLAC